MLTKAEIARVRALHEKKNREAAGQFVIEGEKVVGELLAGGYPFSEIYTTLRHVEPSQAPHGAQFFRITEAEMGRISHFPTPSGLLAIGRLAREPLPEGEINRGLTLALDGVQDAGNVGTLLRIADWYKLDRVLLGADCADLFSQKVINASMGSFARVRAYTLGLAPALAEARIPVLGCDLQGESVHRITVCLDAIIVIGSEGRGISPAVQACISKSITIPRFGSAESLNAAVAAAVVCDNLRRVNGS
jgi:RNA methyltransferase, TrmH family